MTDDTRVYIRPRTAAQLHGVTERTIRKWLRSGKLQGEQVGGTWVVQSTRAELDAAGITYDEAEEPGATPDAGPVFVERSPDRAGPESAPAPVDLEPMQVLIRELTSEIARLSGAAAMYQERAVHLERRVAELEEERKALTAGPPQEPDPGPAPEPPRPWWKRMLGLE